MKQDGRRWCLSIYQLFCRYMKISFSLSSILLAYIISIEIGRKKEKIYEIVLYLGIAQSLIKTNFFYTRRSAPKRVTNLRCPFQRHSAKATCQLLE